jgi:hypothetical protein
MKNQTMQNQSWHNTTVVRMTSVVPAYGFGMGDVRPNTVELRSDLASFKRHAVAIKATPATGFEPWSPPVTCVHTH